MIINMFAKSEGSSSLVGIYVQVVGQTEYEVGDIFTLSGYTIVGVYGNGIIADVTSLCSFTPSGALTEQDTEITISYQGKTCIQNITVSVSQIINYTMLYDEGNEYDNITGGWSTSQGAISKFNTNTMSRVGTSEKLATSLHLNQIGISGSFDYSTVVTVNKIDLSNYVKLFTKWTVSKSSTANTLGALWISSEYDVGDININNTHYWISKYDYIGSGNVLTNQGASVVNLSPTNISAITGNYYIMASVSYGDSTDARANLYIYNLSLFKQDNWQQLCTVAGLTSSDYTDEVDLCSNATAMTAILGSQNAVDYMVRNCTGSYMAEFVSSNIALAALDSSSYKSEIYANEHWNKFLNMALYTELNYIESTGTQYIDTGVNGSGLGTFEMKFNTCGVNSYDTWDQYFAGDKTNKTTCKLYYCPRGSVDPEKGYAVIELQNDNKVTLFLASSTSDHVVQVTSSAILCDGTQKSAYTPGAWGTLTYYVFNAHGEPTLKSSMKLYYLKMWSNETLIRHFVPRIRNSDNVIGLLDLVNNVFYTNAGTGTFIGG